MLSEHWWKLYIISTKVQEVSGYSVLLMKFIYFSICALATTQSRLYLYILEMIYFRNYWLYMSIFVSLQLHNCVAQLLPDNWDSQLIESFVDENVFPIGCAPEIIKPEKASQKSYIITLINQKVHIHVGILPISTQIIRGQATKRTI